jgi:hypothetical protein
VTEPPVALVDGFAELRDLDRATLLDRIGLTEADVRRDVSYQGLEHVDNVTFEGAQIYLRGDGVALIYGDDLSFEVPSASEMQQELGGPGEMLASPASKRGVLHVYPERGIAVSEEDDHVQFVEVFPPTTLDRYRAEIYREPPRFIQ